MDKLKMQSFDVIGSNIQKIAQLFPNCVTEHLGKDGKTELGIDFEKLQAELSNDIIAEGAERYQFIWPDKRAAVRLANAPTTMTLRPCREESVDFDNTENLYIEGDNLDVLKVLRETYLGKVKMIYIDPPYNTGNDFVYNDDFAQGKGEFEETSGLFDEEGNQTVDPMQRNTESNGRFHTDWLNMIYPRLKVARDLLTDDGVIFISIDDNELHNLIKVCDEIFGELNFVGCISRATGTTTGQDANKIGSSLDYCLAYSKTNLFTLNGVAMEEKDLKRFNEVDENGRYSVLQLRKTGNADTREERPNMFYPVIAPDGTEVYPFGPTDYLSRWRVAKSTYDELLRDNLIVWKKNQNDKNVCIDGFIKSQWTPYVKYYLEGRTKQVSNLLQDIEGNKKASIILKELFGSKGLFDNPKPVEFLSLLSTVGANSDSLILDFFSGSATTAHAVIKLNAEDGGNRKFIMVQLPEKTDEKSEAYKAGYKNICEIGKERIRRAGKKVKEEAGSSAQNLDTGFRVLKLDSSNLEDVYYTPQDFSIGSLFTENVKADRTNEDLLFQVMLDLGIELSAKIDSKQIAGKSVHFVDDNYLVACFDRDVNESTITEIAKLQPIYFVMRDASAANDNVIDNFEQIFRHYSPDTNCRII